MLEESKIIWNEFTGAVRQPESPYPFFAGGNQVLQNSRTNPIGNNKKKAADLNLTGTFPNNENK